MYKNTPKPLKVARKAIVLHTFQVRIVMFCLSAAVFRISGLSSCLDSAIPASKPRCRRDSRMAVCPLKGLPWGLLDFRSVASTCKTTYVVPGPKEMRQRTQSCLKLDTLNLRSPRPQPYGQNPKTSNPQALKPKLLQSHEHPTSLKT